MTLPGEVGQLDNRDLTGSDMESVCSFGISTRGYLQEPMTMQCQKRDQSTGTSVAPAWKCRSDCARLRDLRVSLGLTVILAVKRQMKLSVRREDDSNNNLNE